MVRYKVLFFIICGLIIGCILFLFATNFYPLNSAKFIGEKRESKILIVGSSHAGSMKEDFFKHPTFNSWHPAADIFEMCYKVRFITSNIINIKKVFMVISPFSFLKDNAVFIKENYGGMSEMRISLYAQFPSWSLISSDIDNFIVGKLYPLITIDHWAEVFYDDDERSEQEIVLDLDGLNIHAEQRAGEMFDYRFDAMNRQYDGIVVDDAKAVLIETLAELKKKNIDVVMFTPPYWHKYVELIDKRYVGVAFDTAREIADSFNVPYLNYMSDKTLSADPLMFHDADHLSDKGAAKFFEILSADLGEDFFIN